MFTNFIQKYPREFSFILSAVILFSRIYERIFFPTLWAEDGFLFMRDAIQFGFENLTVSYAGYFHTIPRLISIFVFYLIPVKYYPLAILFICVSIYIYVITEFTKIEYECFISSIYFRILLVLLLCFVPGLFEVLGNLANLHWILFFYLSILFIKNSNYNWSYKDLLIILLILLSTGEPIVFIPLLLFRIFLVYKKYSNLLIKNLLILFFILSTSILNLSKKSEQPPGTPHSTKEIIMGANYVLNNFYIYQPIIGEKKLNRFFKFDLTLYKYTGLLFFSILVFLILRKKLYLENYFFEILLLVLGIPILTFIVRPGSLISYINLDGIWNYRYAFALAPWGMLLWFKMIDSFFKEKTRVVLIILFSLFYLVNSIHRYKLEAYDKTVNWYEHYTLIEKSIQTGCPKNPSIPIAPVLRNPITGKEDRMMFGLDFKNDKICED
jgi:hypothetical protein